MQEGGEGLTQHLGWTSEPGYFPAGNNLMMDVFTGDSQKYAKDLQEYFREKLIVRAVPDTMNKLFEYKHEPCSEQKAKFWLENIPRVLLQTQADIDNPFWPSDAEEVQSPRAKYGTYEFLISDRRFPRIDSFIRLIAPTGKLASSRDNKPYVKRILSSTGLVVPESTDSYFRMVSAGKGAITGHGAEQLSLVTLTDFASFLSGRGHYPAFIINENPFGEYVYRIVGDNMIQSGEQAK